MDLILDEQSVGRSIYRQGASGSKDV